MGRTKLDNIQGTVTMFKTYQGAPYRLYKRKFKSIYTKRELEDLKEIILRYHPTYTNKDIMNLYRELKEGGCAYASLANVIIEQARYDDETFQRLFGYSMYKEDGSIHYNKIMVHLYACLGDMVGLMVHKYQIYHFSNAKEAARNLLHESFETNLGAIGALFDGGWITDGLDETGKIIIKSRMCENKAYLGTYASIAKELFGFEYVDLNKEQLCQLLKKHYMGGTFSYEEPQAKLSGILQSSSMNLWVNKFFEVNHINLRLTAEEIPTRNVRYEDFVEDVSTRLRNGYSIEVGIPVGSEVFMTNGHVWENPSSKRVGHQMNFQGFDRSLNLIVCSWGQPYIIPKEFYAHLEVQCIRIEGRDRVVNRENKKKQ